MIKDLLKSARKGHVALLMNQINAGEVFYRVAKHALSPDPERFWNWFLQLPIVFVSHAFDLVIDAARVKARYPISYADAFTVATAQREDAAILTGDPDFKQVQDLVKIEWL